MPQACNEAVNYIASRLGTNEVLNELEKGDTNYYDLSSIFGNFRMLKGLFADIPISWKNINKNVVYIDNWESGNIMASYEVKPTIITSSTSDSHEIELLPEYANLIPLYVAGELYKDDDLTLATMYMNEFMTLVNNYVDNPYGAPTPTIERIYSIGG